MTPRRTSTSGWRRFSRPETPRCASRAAGPSVPSAGSADDCPARGVLVTPQTDSEQAEGPTITAMFMDGPLRDRSIQAGVVEGRPPKTIDVPGDDGGACRYCLSEWTQSGPSAAYSFLYRV